MYESVYKSAYEQEVDTLLDAMSEASSAEATAATKKQAKEEHARLLVILDKLFARGELNPNDQALKTYYGEIKRNKSSLVSQQLERGMAGAFLESLVLPSSISARFEAIRMEHEMKRMEMGYEGMVKKGEQRYKFSVGLKNRMMGASECLQVIQKFEKANNSAVESMTDQEALRSFFTGERQLHKVRMDKGTSFEYADGLYGDVLIVANPEDEQLGSGEIAVYHGFDLDRLAGDHWSTKAFSDSVLEAVAERLRDTVKGEYSIRTVSVPFKA